MTNFFDDFYANAAKDYDYQALVVGGRIAKSIENTMIKRGVNNKSLAELLGCKPSYVSKLLRGEQNLSLRSLAKISIALDCEVRVSLVNKVPISLDCINDLEGMAAASKIKGNVIEKLRSVPSFANKLDVGYSSSEDGGENVTPVAA